jgi:hypothetical protein
MPDGPDGPGASPLPGRGPLTGLQKSSGGRQQPCPGVESSSGPPYSPTSAPAPACARLGRIYEFLRRAVELAALGRAPTLGSKQDAPASSCKGATARYLTLWRSWRRLGPRENSATPGGQMNKLFMLLAVALAALGLSGPASASGALVFHIPFTSGFSNNCNGELVDLKERSCL